MNKAIQISWLCTVVLGGFLAFSSNSQYFVWIIIPFSLAVLAYKIMAEAGKKIFLFESAINVLAGLVLGFLFTRAGLMSGLGILCMLVMLLRMAFRVWKIYKIECVSQSA